MNELYHYGILGMKWGVRRTPEQLGHKKLSRRQARRQAEKNDFRRRDPKTMSDDELRKDLNRLQMEKQFESLAKKKTGEGKAFAKKALTTVGMMVVTSLAVDAIKTGKPLAGELIRKGKDKVMGLWNVAWVL